MRSVLTKDPNIEMDLEAPDTVSYNGGAEN